MVQNNKMLLMGNEAIARGAVEAGVQLVSGYPGTPSSEVFETLAHFAKEYGYYAEWSVNEKVALEVAAGAAYSGARAMVTMKQVGLNVASDPLMTLAYIGVKGGLVLVVADDPGPHSSQTEQDTRKFAQFAKLPVFDPATPQEAKDMTIAAFELSEQLGMPVILRPTTRTCHVCQDVTIGQVPTQKNTPKFEKDPGWIIFPSLAYKRHIWLNQQQKELSRIFSASDFNKINLKTKTGIITSGVSYNYAVEALASLGQQVSILKIGTPYPLPEAKVLEFLEQVDRVLIIEEQEPVVEDQVIHLSWRHQLKNTISGKYDGLVPREGELNVNKIMAIINQYLGLQGAQEAATGMAEAVEVPAVPDRLINSEVPELPLRTPVLCAGCPHRSSFYAFKEALKELNPVFTGDIGCYTLGTIPPLNALDTCLCMGASVTMASGLAHVEPNRKHVAFLGDSTFFHSGVTGLINAVYNRADITLVILDNSTTAMTGFQPHPGMDRNATGEPAHKIDIAGLVKGCGVEYIRQVDAYNLKEAMEVAREAVQYDGPSVVIMQRECVNLVKTKIRYQVNNETCVDCQICLKKLGCPALYREEQVIISEKCNGCGLCADICPAQAIEEVQG